MCKGVEAEGLKRLEQKVASSVDVELAEFSGYSAAASAADVAFERGGSATLWLGCRKKRVILRFSINHWSRGLQSCDRFIFDIGPISYDKLVIVL